MIDIHQTIKAGTESIKYADGWNAAIDIIDAAPTVEIDRSTRSQFKRMAVQLGYEPVVHCKDCKFSRELDKLEKEIYLNNCRACRCPEASQDGYMIVFPEHFCSYGKRRADFVDDNKIGERRTDE